MKKAGKNFTCSFTGFTLDLCPLVAVWIVEAKVNFKNILMN